VTEPQQLGESVQLKQRPNGDEKHSEFKFEAKMYLITRLGTIISLDYDFRLRAVV